MPQPDPTDEALMLRLRDGDDLALNAIMHRWEKPLISFTLRYTRNHADAIDLAQETFVRIYEKRNRYRPGARFSTWLFAIAANLCRNHARWKSRHPVTPLLSGEGHEENDDHSDSAADPAEWPDQSAQRADEAQRIRDAVQSLPHDLRTSVILFEFEGLSHAEIGAVIGCTPKAVETRLYRARQLLRERLKALVRPGCPGSGPAP